MIKRSYDGYPVAVKSKLFFINREKTAVSYLTAFLKRLFLSKHFFVRTSLVIYIRLFFVFQNEISLNDIYDVHKKELTTKFL